MNKRLALAAITLLAMSTSALAQTTNTATGSGVGISESNSASGAVAIARGGSVNIAAAPATTTANVVQSGTVTSNINQKVSGTQTVRSAPSMVAPGLAAAGLETCLGSASGTVSAVGFGIGGGSTYKDEDCTARLDSRTLYSMGLKAAAVARLCQRPDVWRSMPDICQKYWPVGLPLPYGIVVNAPAPRAQIVLSTSVGAPGAVRVVDGRDGVEKDCVDYSAGRQKCFQWAGEAPRRRVAALTPPKTSVTPKAVSHKPKLPAAKPEVTTTAAKPAEDKK